MLLTSPLDMVNTIRQSCQWLALARALMLDPTEVSSICSAYLQFVGVRLVTAKQDMLIKSYTSMPSWLMFWFMLMVRLPSLTFWTCEVLRNWCIEYFPDILVHIEMLFFIYSHVTDWTHPFLSHGCAQTLADGSANIHGMSPPLWSHPAVAGDDRRLLPAKQCMLKNPGACDFLGWKGWELIDRSAFYTSIAGHQLNEYASPKEDLFFRQN